MDNVLVDFKSALIHINNDTLLEYEGRLDEVPGIFGIMKPIDGSIDAYHKLNKIYDCYILSTAPWENDSAWSDKIKWVKKYLGEVAHKRLILTHNKNLNKGHYLIDDRLKNGVDKFEGEHIHFQTDKFPDWDSVLTYLLK